MSLILFQVSYENREFGILVANPDCMRTSVKKITSCDMISSDPCPSSPSPPCRRPPPPRQSRPKPCGPCGDVDSPPASTCRTACQKLPHRGNAPVLLRTLESRHVQYHHEMIEEFSDLESSPLEEELGPKGRCTASSSRAKANVPREKMGRNDKYMERESILFGEEPEPMGRCTACSSKAKTHVSRNKMGHAESWNYVNPNVQKGQQSKKSIKKQQSMHPSPSAPPVTTVSRGYQPSYLMEPSGGLSKHTAGPSRNGQEGFMENELDLWDEDIQTSFTKTNGSWKNSSQRPLPSSPAFPHQQQAGPM